MSTDLMYPHIEKPEGDTARLKYHARMRVALIVTSYVAYGGSVDEMCRQYPFLKPAELHAAMAYYYDHQEEIDSEIRQELKQADEELARARANPSPLVLRWRAQGLL